MPQFQEEDDLVSAHRRQVEETMEIVREVSDVDRLALI